MTVPTLSITEDQQFTALRGFLLGLVSSTTEVFKAQQNRVPEPRVQDFIVMTPLRIERLGTNLTTLNDAVVVGSIVGSAMDVTTVVSGVLTVGAALTDGTAARLSGTTSVLAQTSGSIGGTGAYLVAGSQAFPSGLLYAGVRSDQTQTQWTVQLDVHGPESGNNVQRIVSLFRSEAGYDAFIDSGYQVAPLHCDNGSQLPFVNAEKAFEFRWVLDAVMQVNPVVGTQQSFADQLETGLINVDVVYPP